MTSNFFDSWMAPRLRPKIYNSWRCNHWKCKSKIY